LIFFIKFYQVLYKYVYSYNMSIQKHNIYKLEMRYMITSMVIDSIKDISFIKIELDTANGKIIMQKAKYDITSEELYQTIENKHRVCLPCRIDDNIASFYVPMEWDVE